MKKNISILFVLLICIVQVYGQHKEYLPGGIFYGKTPQQEVLSARTEFTKKFNLGNGIADLYFGGPFHYKDSSGQWQDIHLNVKKYGTGFGNAENKFTSLFAENAVDGVSMKYNNELIQFGRNTRIFSGTWTPASANKPQTVLNGNIISYEGIYKDVDLHYALTTEAIFHSIIFKNNTVFGQLPQSNHSLIIEETIVLPPGAVLKDDNGVISNNRVAKGIIRVVVKDKVIFSLMPSYIKDASFAGEESEQLFSGESLNNFRIIETSIEFLTTNKIKFVASMPVNWLLAPERIYPLTFDPPVYVGNVGSYNGSYRYPFNTCHQQRLSQFIFRKSDINAGGVTTTGTITDIAFFQNTPVPINNNNVQIKMQETTQDAFTSPTPTNSGWQPVVNPSTRNFTSGSNTWRTLTLDFPFPFTNTSNLMIEARFGNTTSTSGCSCTNTAPGGHWGWYNAPYAGHRWAYSNSSASPPSGNDCNYNNSPEGNPAYGYFIPATRLTINTTTGCVPVSFTNHPSSRTVVAPASVQFTVAVSGTNPTYRWEISTDNGNTWGNVNASTTYAGVTTNQLTVNPTNAGMNGDRFRCRVTNTCTPTTVISNTAVLTVNAAGCATLITPASSANIPAIGGGGTFVINVTPNTCSWSLTETISWVTITSALSGSGDATINYTATNNPGGFRSGTISVNGEDYTVNQSGGPNATTYVISGRVVTNGSTGIPGVTISTSPAQGTATTDAQGYYTLNVPLNYTGSVAASLAPYTFTPASRTVSSTNNDDKDFDAIAVSLQITSSVIPPWQREGDDYNGSITVQLGNTTTNAWHIVAEVYDANNAYINNVQFPSATGTTSTFNTATGSAGQQLRNLSLNGRTVKYKAVFDANSSIEDDANGSTAIIEKQWNNKNYVFYNSGTGQILIPLKYFPNTISTTISFSRVQNVSTESNKITNVPTVQIGNQQFYVLNNVNSLIRSVAPGVFNYTIKYNPSGFFQESGSFDLTKIGHVHNTNSTLSTIVVLVGGIRNTIEADILDLPSTYNSQSNDPWSVANDLSLHYGINTWYIAQGNMNSTQKNAYDLGIALEEIRKLCINAGVNAPNISVIAHSKGGLEMRLMMDGKGAPASSAVNFTTNPINPFTNRSINNSLRAAIFLGTPHHGSNFAYAILNTPGGQDLKPNSALINYLNSGTSVPGVRIANISGYQISALGNALLDVIGDGLVTLESSSQNINITGQSLFRQFYLAEDYNPFGIENYLDYLLHTPNIVDVLNHIHTFTDFIYRFSFHSKLHRSSRLNDAENSCPTYSAIPLGSGPLCQLQVSPGTTNMLLKILSVINNSNVASDCISPADFSCFAAGNTWASVLPNVKISKYNGTSQPSSITSSDETGRFTFRLNDSLKVSDRLIFSANGVDPLILNLDSSEIQIGKFPIVFFKSQLSSLGIEYAKIGLPRQELITNRPLLPININSVNSLSYDIMSNRDTAFRRVSFTDTTAGLPLDTGLNIVVVRFNGNIDSIVLGKIVYYFPDPLFDSSTYKINIIANTNTLKTNVYLNNYFYKQVNSLSSQMSLLVGKSQLDFYRFGYHNFHVNVNSPTTIDLNLMQPVTYSSISDSTIFNFESRPNPQYWKTITVKNLSPFNDVPISAKQYDDPFIGISLKPQTRKFAFRRANSINVGYYKTAIALDQINTPDKDSVYLLSIKGNRYIKYLPNEPGITEYDPEVQKLEFDKLDFTGNSTHDIALMQKQAPIMRALDTTWHSGQTLKFPINMLIADPDSIKGDIAASSTDLKVRVDGNMIYVTAPVDFTGTTTFTVTGTHDWLNVTRTYKMAVIPPEVFMPTAFTPNNDGRNDIIAPVFMGKLMYCHFSIFNRSGQKLYETRDCLGGWDGSINGVKQSTNVLVYQLTYRFEGTNEKEKQIKGTFTLIR